MMVVRSRCAALGAIIEESTVWIYPGKLKHVLVTSNDCLIRVLSQGDNQVLRKNRIWIYKEMIFISLPADKADPGLFLRAIIFTKETPAAGNILLAEFRS